MKIRNFFKFTTKFFCISLLVLFLFLGTKFFSNVLPVLSNTPINNFINIESRIEILNLLKDPTKEVITNLTCYNSIFESISEVVTVEAEIDFIYWGEVRENPLSGILCSYRIFSRKFTQDRTVIQLYSPFRKMNYPIINDHKIYYQVFNIFFVLFFLALFINSKKKKYNLIYFLYLGLAMSLLVRINKNTVLLLLAVGLFLIFKYKNQPKMKLNYIFFTVAFIAVSNVITINVDAPLKNSKQLNSRPDVQSYIEVANSLNEKTVMRTSHLSDRNLILISPKSYDPSNDYSFLLKNIDNKILEPTLYKTINWVTTGTTSSFYIPEYDIMLNKNSKIKIGNSAFVVPYYRIDNKTLYFVNLEDLEKNG